MSEAREEIAPDAVHDGTLLQLEGGHTTMLRVPVADVERGITRARQEQIEFVYLQAPNLAANSYVVDPNKVVAMISTGSRL